MSKRIPGMVGYDIDGFGVVKNNVENAMRTRQDVMSGEAVAFALSLGNMTMFHISFVNLDNAIPSGVVYSDGSARGCQINIDRHKSYALPWGSCPIAKYISEKWGVCLADAEALRPFFGTVLTGENWFKEKANI